MAKSRATHRLWLLVALLAAACASESSSGDPTAAEDTTEPDLPDNGTVGGGVPTFDSQVVDTTPDPVDTDEEPDLDVAGEDTETDSFEPECGPIGSACNDGDLCTFNDACAEPGVCQGEPIVCDDGAPCTSDQCVSGTCTAGVTPGFCFIEGVCWSDGQPNPDQPLCQSCDTRVSIAEWKTATGFACNDGDECTENDTCQAAGCVGTPTGCDDGNSCTDDACNPRGGCVHTPLEGPCDAGQEGACQTGECVAGVCSLSVSPSGSPCDDGNACTIDDTCQGGTCVPGPLKDEDMDTFVDLACGGLDCQDGQMGVNPDAAEVCSDGIDNDCDGATDQVDDECCGGTACTYHTDCYPDMYCGEWSAECGKRCVTPCAGQLDCPGELICTHLPGSAGMGYCRPSNNPDGAAFGTACGAAADCKSELCVGVCADYCSRESGCPASNANCTPAGNLGGEFFGICAPNLGIGTTPLGSVCTNANFCIAGHCDYLSPTSTCAALCKADTDCALSQECNIFLPAGNPAPGFAGGNPPNPQSVPFDPAFTTPTYDTALGCFGRQFPSGNLQPGQPCTSNAQCRGNKCFGLDPANPTQTWCTTFCASDVDCPGTMKCKPELVSLVSWWLQNYGGVSTTARTLVKVCKFP